MPAPSPIPIDNPIKMPDLLPKSNRCILKELEERIKESDALLVLAGMYVRHSAWIQSEIEAASEFCKPIIGVKPRGQERIPAALPALACELVGWTTDSIVGAIRRHAKPSRTVVAPMPIPSGLRTGALRSIAALAGESDSTPKMAAPIPTLRRPPPTLLTSPTNTHNVPSGSTGPTSESENLAALFRLLYNKK
jgi:hypothetical protein